jgi:hypothetical protein
MVTARPCQRRADRHQPPPVLTLWAAVLAERAYALYEAFRPAIPAGQAGWGARGTLDLAKIRALAAR